MGRSHTAFVSSKKTVCGPAQSLHPAQGSLSDVEPSPSSLNTVSYHPATKKLEDKLSPLALALTQEEISAQRPEVYHKILHSGRRISTETRSLS